MATIWKYPVQPGRFALDVPVGAVPLTVQMQGDTPVLYLQVDPERPKTRAWFRVVPTGASFEPATNGYIGTFQLYDGALVFHLFADLDGGA